MSTGQGILGNNIFAYCLNNPVNRIDILGNVSLWYYLIIDSDMGFIHRAVQAHILSTYGAAYSQEVALGGIGRADIVDTENGLVWEIKHAGQTPELRALIAVAQAKKYIGGSSNKAVINALGAAGAFEGFFYILCGDSYYRVSYTTPTAGAILYSVQEIQNYSGNEAVVYVPKKQRESKPGIQATGMIGAFIGGGGGRFHSAEDITNDMEYSF